MSTLLQQLTTTIERLAPVWGPFLKEKQGLDLAAVDLAGELSRSLDVDRAVPGFEDFAPGATRAVEPAEPAHSLLYHALASPNVRPDGIGAADYPTWAELDVLENYIYGLKPIGAEELADKCVVVFAYQYRPKPATTHRLYADLAYSRMGFSRVGNVDPFYAGANRGFTSYTGVSGEVAVLPARYGAFLAEWRKGTDDALSLIGEEVGGDQDRQFLYPLRKLFAGDECVAGHTLSLTFAESHLSTKLQRVVNGEGTPDGKPLTLPPGLDANRLPFVRKSPDPELAVMQHEGPASVSIRPPAGAIVRLAKQHNSVSNRDEIARFQVSPAAKLTIEEVVAAIKGSDALTALMNQAVPAMQQAHKLDELMVQLGDKLDANPAVAQLTGNTPVAKMTAEQIKAVLPILNGLLEKATNETAKEEFKLLILTFQVIVTIKQLDDPASEKTVSDADKARLLGFDFVVVRNTVLNRHYSSLSMVGDAQKVIAEGLQLTLRQPARVGRGAPEFANIRHQVINPAYPVDASQFATHLKDLNTLPDTGADESPFEKILQDGDYEAALFEDGVSDGCVTASVSGLPTTLADYAAFSVIGAPSLFPRSSDLDLEAWWRLEGENQFAEGNPQPLAEGRLSANPAITRPDGTTKAFDKMDKTMAAVVGRPSGKPGHPPCPNHLRKKFPTSFMPDSASNEFYPGWDVTIDRDTDGSFFYTTHGLGSPYPEDVKFCSAANGFWPAAAPDSARVFHRLDTPTSIPLLDSELGLHPDSPAVKAGAKAAMGWDGGYGPFFQDAPEGVPGVSQGTLGVNYASIDRTDYVSNALAGRFGLDLYEKLDSDVLIERLDVQKLAIEALPPPGDYVRDTALWLIVARDGEDWSVKGDPDLTGNGYFLQFVTTPAPTSAEASPVQLESKAGTTQTNLYTRLWQKVDAVYTCRATVDGVRWWTGSSEEPPKDSTLYKPRAETTV